MQAYWNAVESSLADAKGICWDECHKIYVLMDDVQVRTSESYGYEVLSVDELGEEKALELLKEWYDASCSLKFIQAVSTVEGNPNDGYKDLIPQFAK